MYAQILTARKRSLAREKYKVEYCDYGMQSCQMVVQSNISKECHLVSTEHYQMLKIDPSVISSVFEELKPLAEKWIDNRIELVGTAVYGLRKYTRGAWLHAHLDHLRTHVVSAILNIAQDVDEDWPLQIEDHQGNKYEIILAPGDMVWYESAKLIHARIKPFKGRSYENIFVHYMPRSLNWYTEDVGLTSEPSRIITISDLENAEIEFKEQRKKARDELEKREKSMEEKYSALSVEERLAVLSKL
ncbi:uncharacterized protein LOC111713088 [Eurytemora carolleeae]|uniref:uncharacterized protein LOC111713088 n=1 Tax=Eurytemora carolleeae TaxID=1294199 RepID=UPI000C7889A2|nr:uncharacterized protein LOC111713088 [Eurytemora carolleeae]|eukprot:XP_023343650.1 uncharacterized protein LOC111713088 [Eurytemora affinis]